MVTIVNYGIGNIQALRHIYQMLGIPVVVASGLDDILAAERIILPGVGAFDWAMERLEGSGLRKALDERVLTDRIPVLGICVGMQMMALRSEEGVSTGLGWLDAEVRDMHADTGANGLPLPHMGWNEAISVRESPLFHGLESPRFYFLHSYRFCPNDEGQTVAVTRYGIGFSSAVSKGNVHGVQFHPEKSHDWGVQLLKNFAVI
jgi:glutamine amidotransferase